MEPFVFVVTVAIPGFHKGAIVDLRAGRAGFFLSHDDYVTLKEFRRFLRPVAEAGIESTPEAAEGLQSEA